MHFGRKGKSREKDAQNGQLWHLGKSFRSIHRAAAADDDDDDAADDDEKGDHQGDILNTISVQKCRKNNKNKTFEKTDDNGDGSSSSSNIVSRNIFGEK